MARPLPTLRLRSAARRRAWGMTLLECVLAMAILAFVTLGLMYTASASHRQLAYAETELRAVRLAEHLVEEILTRPYDGTGGGSRTTWHVDDYDGFTELPGEVADFSGMPYDDDEQKYGRSVSVDPATLTIADLGPMTVAGKTVVVTIRHSDGHETSLSRFVPEPYAP